MPSPQEILEKLRSVKYPGFSRDIVSFGLVKDIEVAHGGVTVSLRTPSARADVISEIAAEVKRIVAAMDGVPAVEVTVEQVQASRPAAAAAGPQPLAGVDHVIAVASGKGGVGKSTVAVNLALAMHSLGRSVGLMDADVYGPSLAMMVGGTGERPQVTPEKRIVPLRRFGIRYISIAHFVDAQAPIIWRGPMVAKAENEFLFNVEWGRLDCLVLDLPPGTGDAQLPITQRVALAGGIVVTTPQEIALLDVRRGIAMFQEAKVAVLGVVENMSYYLCRKCGHRHEIFGHGGGARLAAELGVPFLGELPLLHELRAGGDEASPLVAARPDHPASAVFREIAGTILERLEQPAAQPQE